MLLYSCEDVKHRVSYYVIIYQLLYYFHTNNGEYSQLGECEIQFFCYIITY